MARKLPPDKKKRNQIIIGIKNAIHATFDESMWKDLGYRTGTQDWIASHPRLLRSLSWGDSDYEGHVLDAIEKILEEDPSNLDELLDTPAIADWLKEKDAASLAGIIGGPDGGPAPAVAQPTLKVSSKAVESALADADALLKSKGPSSAIDRVHTALHGYLLAICDAAGIPYNPDPSVMELFKAIRQHHPKMQSLGPHAAHVKQILQGCASQIHVINELRNHASGAHPNKDVLAPEEAMLVINATSTIFWYLNSKI